VGSIPATAEKQGVATQEELLERYHGAAEEAVRRLLVPEIGGVAAELLGTVRLRFLQVCMCVYTCVGGWGGRGWVGGWLMVVFSSCDCWCPSD